ncbi:MAG: SUMF1/EgtB/PvdO family nonheme iron enzyme [Spirochaetales bacterium]|nr:SUMF1/EgtB/PvdO family nonheme iron enzyme [Spirochaetales bacterium]
MRKLLISFAALAMVLGGACTPQAQPGEVVFVKGGPIKNTKSGLHTMSIAVSDFYIGKYEVTQKEWVDVMGSNPSKFKGDNLPVESVSWYDCIEFCNKKSLKESLKPVYNIDKTKKDPNNKNDNDDMKWTVTFNEGADGYRLPLEVEWEYVASGGQLSRNYKYSGSDTIDEVAWYWKNSGDKPLKGYWSREIIEQNHNQTKPIGLKSPNELGLYDMSGNVREWCWDWYGDTLFVSSGTERVWRGGGWLGVEDPCTINFRGYQAPNVKWDDTGFRVCRNKPAETGEAEGE